MKSVRPSTPIDEPLLDMAVESKSDDSGDDSDDDGISIAEAE